jgi:hypothetical protein
MALLCRGSHLRARTATDSSARLRAVSIHWRLRKDDGVRRLPDLASAESWLSADATIGIRWTCANAVSASSAGMI